METSPKNQAKQDFFIFLFIFVGFRRFENDEN